MSLKQLVLLMLGKMTMVMMMIVGLRRRWRRGANGVHTKLLLSGTAVCRLLRTFLTLVMMLSLITNLLVVMMWKPLLGRSSGNFFTSVVLRLLSSTLFIQLIHLQWSVTALQSVHASYSTQLVIDQPAPWNSVTVVLLLRQVRSNSSSGSYDGSGATVTCQQAIRNHTAAQTPLSLLLHQSVIFFWNESLHQRI